ncbi:MAG: SDR family oxidoreductase [Burkholderiaceae bacterium]
MNLPSDDPASPSSHRAVLVTGAARRLGREIAIGLARAGWDVAIHYGHSADDAQRTVADIRALGRRALAVQADLADEQALRAMFATACAELPIRALVNNASRFDDDRPETVTAASMHAHLAPNLIAPVLLTRCLFEQLDERARGVVINLLDQKLERLNPDFFSYTLGKQALWAATRMMAMAYAPRLRVLGVSPGLTLPSHLQTDEAFARAHRDTALLDRSSTPADIVAAVRFLIEQPAITGVNLTVDGGQHLMGLARDVSFLAPAAQAHEQAMAPGPKGGQ